MAEPVRLQKFLARAGVASRRKAETLILAGRVRVNGKVVTELGVKVDADSDVVEVGGERVERAPPVWLALNKPPGYVTTRREPGGRPTVYDLLPAEYHALFYVGRLDLASEGLLLMTNEGSAANRLTHPRYGVDRVYEVVVEGKVPNTELKRLKAGIELEDGVARAREVVRLRGAAPGETRLRITLAEGRKREVRRMFRALGYPVLRLVRVRYGPIRLDSLAPGTWRRLSANEILMLDARTSNDQG